MAKKKKEKRRVVVVGGGGVAKSFACFKKYFSDARAIISMTDSGGSTGRLRKEWGVLATGDLRRALAISAKNKPLAEVFNERFSGGRVLDGHTLGNLLIGAFLRLSEDAESGLREVKDMLRLDSEVIPVTLTNAHLVARLENGEKIVGETNIDKPKHDPFVRIKKLQIEPRAKLNPSAKRAIEGADVVVIGPGDLYSSLLANIVVPGFKTALGKTKAKIIFVVNILNRRVGETTGFTTADFMREAEKYLGKNVIDVFLINNSKISEKRLGLRPDENLIEIKVPKAFEKRVLLADFTTASGRVRTDSEKLTKLLIEKVL